MKEEPNQEAMNYVKSLRDPIKRRYAVGYLDWLRSGKTGPTPNRGALAAGLAKAVGVNLEALI